MDTLKRDIGAKSVSELASMMKDRRAWRNHVHSHCDSVILEGPVIFYLLFSKSNLESSMEKIF